MLFRRKWYFSSLYIRCRYTYKNDNQQNLNSQEIKCSGEKQWCLDCKIMHRMDLYINTLTGTVFELRVSPYEAILSIKARLQRNEGKPLASAFCRTGFLLWEKGSISLLILCKFQHWRLSTTPTYKHSLALPYTLFQILSHTLPPPFTPSVSQKDSMLVKFNVKNLSLFSKKCFKAW